MTAFARTDTSMLGCWWWTVDRWTLAAIGALIGIGALMILAASPPVADRLGMESFYFVRRQLTYLPVALGILLSVSILSPRGIRRLGVIGFLIALILLALTPVFGAEIKGAQRWISLGHISLQPSEFIKPTFAVVAAWMFAQQRLHGSFPGDLVSTGLYLLVTGLLVLQPDFGMALVISAAWFTQFFLAGLPIFWVALCTLLGAAAIVVGYYMLPHVQSRIDRFLDPSLGDSYQVDTAPGRVYERRPLWPRARRGDG